VKAMMNELHVALDSQCMSYLIDAMEGVEEPTCNVGDQKKALIRIWLYTPVLFHVSETVRAECAQIQDEQRRALHADYAITLLWDPPVRHQDAVDRGTLELLRSHPGESDCRVLAEAEEHSFDALLTFDHDFWTRLASKALVVPLQTPIQFWGGLGIPRGTRPTKLPHRTNPLSHENWWRW
jgi:predicted nucleic acid-binding protein